MPNMNIPIAVSLSKGEYKRLTERLRNAESARSVSTEDYEMLQGLRVQYKDPLSKVFTIINRLAHRVDSDSVCTYRIKRIESIVSKVQRQNKMQVHRMADIAGCRCIMSKEEDAIRLYERLCKYAAKNTSRLSIKGENNYIAAPKANGYRSIHLNVVVDGYPDKVIEIQIRSIEQHNWATLVEISDVVYGFQLKEYNDRNSPTLYEFHQLLSKRYEDLSFQDKKRIADISGELKYLEQIGKTFEKNTIELREQRNQLNSRRFGTYYIMITDRFGNPQIKQFLDFSDAEKAYFELFSKNEDNKNIVMTHIANVSFNKISIAYSNYVMTYNATLFKVLRAIGEVAVMQYNKYHICSFRKNYKAFWGIISTWFLDRVEELQKYGTEKRTIASKKKEEWSISLSGNFLAVWRIIQEVQSQFNRSLLYLPISIHKDMIDDYFEHIQELFGLFLGQTKNFKRNQG